MSSLGLGVQGARLGNVIRHEWAEDGTTLLLEAALANIRDEIANDFAVGKIRPFKEGEPIGTIQKQKVHTVELETPEHRWERRQWELHDRQERNDRRLDHLLLEE